ncbi:MAG: type I restriction enzyme HsdR N-terminal domain-containing protein [Desulfobacteraceae bacterium]|nr:type I restriction enzyme HsdR N-terminal domain-containing protein [Desulfobacteraceae bacterium]
MGTHHLILGETTDFITERAVTDTHDERARQKIAKFLIKQKGYEKTDIHPRLRLPLEIDGRTGEVGVDFLIKPEGRPFMVILFRPGSLVSRRRTALAVARLVENSVIPYAAVTNAEDAEIMETFSGKVIGSGLDAIFSRTEAIRMLDKLQPLSHQPDEGRREKEKRILFAMEVLTQKECEDYTCGSL